MMRREGIAWLSSTHKSIEEIATTILRDLRPDRRSTSDSRVSWQGIASRLPPESHPSSALLVQAHRRRRRDIERLLAAG